MSNPAKPLMEDDRESLNLPCRFAKATEHRERPHIAGTSGVTFWAAGRVDGEGGLEDRASRCRGRRREEERAYKP